MSAHSRLQDSRDHNAKSGAAITRWWRWASDSDWRFRGLCNL